MTRPDAVIDELLTRFERLHPKSIDLSLDRIYRLLNALGNPHEKLPPVIHVAGTNGKGSVIAYMRAILEAAGYGVHVFTSPHLRRFNERVVLAGAEGGRPISDLVLRDVLARAEAANDEQPITFFEITTAAAFLAFAETPADFVLLETGLGGRLDATNVIDAPKLAAITPVSSDHSAFLGDTVEEIASEKAGILKPGLACVVSRQDEEALEVIKRKALEVGASLIIGGEQWDVYEQHGRLVFQDGRALLDLPLPRLAGAHQVGNAGTAIAMARALEGIHIAEEHLATGLSSAVWPARMDRLSEGTLHQFLPASSEIWLDGGHNIAAAEVLARAMADLEERVSRPLFLVLGMMSTKDAPGFLDYFQNLASFVAATDIPGQPNAYTAQELSAIARHKGFVSEPAGTLQEALKNCAREAGNEPVRVLITGSLYLAGHVLEVQEHGLEA